MKKHLTMMSLQISFSPSRITLVNADFNVYEMQRTSQFRRRDRASHVSIKSSFQIICITNIKFLILT